LPTDKPRLQVLVSKETHERLQELLKGTGKSMSQLGGDLIEEALDARSVASGKASVIEQLRHVLQQLESDASR